MTDEVDPGFSVQSHSDGAKTTLVFEGDLDLLGAEAADAALAGAQAGGRPVLLDLRSLRFMDSSGLRVVLGAQKRSTNGGGPLTIATNDGVRRVLALSGVDSLVELVELVDLPEETA